MTESLQVTLNIAQLFLLGGVIWGIAQMSERLKGLTTATGDLADGLGKIGDKLALLGERVAAVEGGRHGDERRHS